jgi:GNAT superfamily N-acetyltransferase
MTLPISIRVAEPKDVAFIATCWLQSKRHTPPWDAASWTLFLREERPRVENRIKRSAALVAYWEEHPDELVSFVVYRAEFGSMILEYAYTRAEHRRQGAASMLLHAANAIGLPIVATHVPRNDHVARAWRSKMVFDPWFDEREKDMST